MVLWWRRVGSDPFYLNYEKSFEKIAEKEGLIQQRQATRRRRISFYASVCWWLGLSWLAGFMGFFGHAQRSGWINTWQLKTSATLGGVGVGVALLLMGLSYLLSKLLGVMERRDAVYLKRLSDSRKKMLKELKDSTHFERTMALLRKYDPEARPPPTPPAAKAPGAAQQGRAGGNVAVSPYTPSQLLARTGNFAGKALFSTFDTLAGVIGDNPELLEHLKRAQQEAERLRKENEMLRYQLAQATGQAPPTPLLALEPVSPRGSSAPGTLQQPLLLGPADASQPEDTSAESRNSSDGRQHGNGGFQSGGGSEAVGHDSPTQGLVENGSSKGAGAVAVATRTQAGSGITSPKQRKKGKKANGVHEQDR